MKVFISGDIEGITGLVAWSQCGRPNSDHYDFEFARRMYTHDINAAIRGARAAGADAVFLKDSHGNSKNLLIDQLEPGVRLVSGYGGQLDGMMVGIDASMDAAVLVGYHSMAGTLCGVMEHTISGRVHRMWINNILMGEIGLSALTAGTYNVPVVAISSDHAGCNEATGLVSGIKTAEVKHGLGRYMSNTVHPSETGLMIEEAVQDGIVNRAQIKPLRFEAPFNVTIEFNRTEEADMASRVPGVSRLDGYSLQCSSPNWEGLHRSIWTMISMAEAGAQANN